MVLQKKKYLPWRKCGPLAVCRTCCFKRMIERPKCVKKSMPSKGVATAPSRVLNSKLRPEKQTVKRRNPHAGMVLPRVSSK